MNNKKLIKSLKKSVIKQIESDIKKSVIKDFYKNTSKEQLEELKNQIISEVQESFFGVEKEIEKESETNQTYTPIEIPQGLGIKLESTEPHKDLGSESVKIDAPSIYEHLGFKFDTERMSSIVTGKARTKIPKRPGFDDSERKSVERVDSPNADNYLTDKFKKLSGFPPVPQTKDFVEYDARITPDSKEDLTFFLSKLKDGISKLGKGEKNINYRYSKDDTYLFSYDKVASGNEDFSLSFELELNVKTLAAVVKKFYFNVDGFNFDSSFFELIDVVSVLNYMGMNILKYVDEIVGVNGTGENETKPNKSSKQKQSKFSTKIESIVDDKKLLKLLKDNNINSYGELVEMSSALTNLKGIGSKTAEKIKKYIK